MGSWGTGLYQNDTAADVKMVFGDLSRRPIDTDTLVSRVFEKFDCGKDPACEDDFDIWLALADLLHQYALVHPSTMTRARRMISEGEDMAMKRELGMSPRDLEKRGKVLAETLERWSVPHPKPKKRKAPSAPEPFLLDVGEVWTFPSMQHAARPFHEKDVDLSLFAPDGWGVFAVADRWHAMEHRACYLFVLALPEGRDRPTLDEARHAPLQECTFTLSPDRAWTYPMIFEARLGKRAQGLKKWEAERLGFLPLDAGMVRSLAPDKLKQRYNTRDPDGMNWLEDDLTVTSFHRAASNRRTGLDWHIRPHDDLRLSDLCEGA